MEVSVDFILDDLGKLFTKHNQERYSLSVYGDPVVKSDINRVDDYITVWPCKHDKIAIKVIGQVPFKIINIWVFKLLTCDCFTID